MIEKSSDQDYISLPFYIFKDKRLNYVDIALISLLYSLKVEKNKVERENDEGKADEVKVKEEYLLHNLQLEKGLLHKALKRLIKYGWLENYDNDDISNCLFFLLRIPEEEEVIYHQKGSEIARSWSKYFGSRMIKYEEMQDLKDFIENRGIEEELIIKIMELASENAEGNPFYYLRAVLINLLRNGILTIEQYEKEKGVSKNGKISGNNKKEEEKHSRFKADEYR